MSRKTFYSFKDSRTGEEVYTRENLEQLAAYMMRSRNADFHKENGKAWCDATAIGCNVNKAWFVETIASWRQFPVYEWTKVGKYEIYIEARAKAAFIGRFHIRKVQ